MDVSWPVGGEPPSNMDGGEFFASPGMILAGMKPGDTFQLWPHGVPWRMPVLDLKVVEGGGPCTPE